MTCWMQKFMHDLWKLPRRTRRTASKQTRLEIYSSSRHGVHQACKWTYVPLVLQVHAPLVVYYPLDGDAHQLFFYLYSKYQCSTSGFQHCCMGCRHPCPQHEVGLLECFPRKQAQHLSNPTCHQQQCLI